MEKDYGIERNGFECADPFFFMGKAKEKGKKQKKRGKKRKTVLKNNGKYCKIIIYTFP